MHRFAGFASGDLSAYMLRLENLNLRGRPVQPNLCLVTESCVQLSIFDIYFIIYFFGSIYFKDMFYLMF